ncbi:MULTISPECIES: hypothetical protein [Haloplanus]|jgi:hypothetical protein|uniref:hypothetical protein n=1 Tax=Haloplanus TaxID=376170 RepID=UPI0012FE1060|nr:MULTISPECIES: hypothetical protein [Haloplanus]
MNDSGTIDCPLCPRALSARTELRIHLMVDHRKSTVIDEYVDRLDRRDGSTVATP